MIATLDLAQSSAVDCPSKAAHKPSIKVLIVLVTRLADEVKVAIDQLGLVYGRGCAGELEDETIFSCVICRSVNGGEPEAMWLAKHGYLCNDCKGADGV